MAEPPENTIASERLLVLAEIGGRHRHLQVKTAIDHAHAGWALYDADEMEDVGAGMLIYEPIQL